MRVLIISTDFPPLVGGIGTFACNLAEALQKLGVSVCVLTSVGLRGQECVRNIEVVRMPALLNRKFLKILPLLFAALWRCVKNRPDRVIAMSWTHEGVTAYLVRRMIRVRYAVAAYGSEILRHQQSRVRRALMLLIFRGADIIGAISDFTRHLILRLGVDPSRVVVVHPPIDLPEEGGAFDTHAVDKKFDLEGKRVLLTAARLVRRKGHCQVIRVLGELRDRYPDLVYVMTGEGECRRELEEMAGRYGMTDRVRMTGYVSQEDLQQLYQRAEVCILLSHQDKDDVEGFGIALIEAGACGKPVIVGRSGGVNDAVVDGETGFLVNPLDAGEIKRKLMILLDDAVLRERLGKTGRARVIREFGLRRQGEKLASLFGFTPV